VRQFLTFDPFFLFLIVWICILFIRTCGLWGLGSVESADDPIKCTIVDSQIIRFFLRNEG
jgi:hypothetical protein